MIDRKAFHTLTYGLFVIASKMPDGRKVGCIANTFQQVASDPAQACVSLNKQNTTTDAILKSGRFTASVLAQSSTMELIGVFGFRSSLEIDKFGETEHATDASEIPHLTESCVASFSVRVEQTVDVGSHLLFIGPIEEAHMIDQLPSLTYSYYHEVLRGKTPPKAVSYQADDEQSSAAPAPSPEAEKVEELIKAEPKYAWRCKVCGYIEYVEELPDDYICPICGVGKDMFERIEL